MTELSESSSMHHMQCNQLAGIAEPTEYTKHRLSTDTHGPLPLQHWHELVIIILQVISK